MNCLVYPALGNHLAKVIIMNSERKDLALTITPNMDYCMYRNTISSLNQCLEAFRREEEISDKERVAFSNMLITMVEFIGQIGEVVGLSAEQIIEKVETNPLKAHTIVKQAIIEQQP